MKHLKEIKLFVIGFIILIMAGCTTYDDIAYVEVPRTHVEYVVVHKYPRRPHIYVDRYHPRRFHDIHRADRPKTIRETRNEHKPHRR